MNFIAIANFNHLYPSQKHLWKQVSSCAAAPTDAQLTYEKRRNDIINMLDFVRVTQRKEVLMSDEEIESYMLTGQPRPKC